MEKEQHLGSAGGLSKAERKKLKHERKNKNLKYVLGAKRRQKNEEEDQEDEVIDDAKASKKQKRLAQYGLKK